MTKNLKKHIGKTYSNLLVLDAFSKGKNYITHFSCKCICGKICIVQKATIFRCLREGKSFSCGCSHATKGNHVSKLNDNKAKSRIGERYNRLKIIGIVPNIKRRKNAGYKMICECDCGNLTKQIYADLVNSKVISCGCYGKEQQSIVGSRVGLNNGTINCSKRKWGIKKDGTFIKMRSGFEVMYAMILDKENIKWEYEPKRFKLKDGVRYTPDFYLKEQDLWIDVKGQLTEKHRMKHALFKELGYNFNLVFIKEIQERLGYSYNIFKKQWDEE